jgi:hypothetical protein
MAMASRACRRTEVCPSGAGLSAAAAGPECGEGGVVDAVGGFQVPDHLQVVVPVVGAFWQEGHQHGGRSPGGEDDGLARGEDVSGGLAGDDDAGEVRVDGVAGRGGGPVWAIFSPEFLRRLTVAVAKTRMTSSVGGQGAGVLRSMMQSASAMHWSTISWQVSAVSANWMTIRPASSAWTACSSILWVSS